MIIGTAGHIDHGKTSLVRALTGVNTDRLGQEKDRGISIELGYAYIPSGSGGRLGFVDVPGHERLVHTMAAGASGIDFGLLVVAADDGVMPQTREHLAILGLLGLQRGALVISKTDRVDSARVNEVRDELQHLTANTFLHSAPVFPVSLLPGHETGLEPLSVFLHSQAANSSPRQQQALFRLAIDRAFTLDGHGTVVTGTVHAGCITLNDTQARLLLMPAGTPVRVRSIHAQNRPGQAGVAGQRCALNLGGLPGTAVARGNWVADARCFSPSRHIDVSLQLLKSADQPLRLGSVLHIHLGAAHHIAHVVPLAPDVLDPGHAGRVQLVFNEAVCAMPGDRFIARNAQARQTVGGGQVLDANAPDRKRRSAARSAWLDGLARFLAGEDLMALLEQAPFGLEEGRLMQLTGQPPDRFPVSQQAFWLESGSVRTLISHQHWNTLAERVKHTVTHFHQQAPDDPGIDAARLRRMALPTLPESLWPALLETLVQQGHILRQGPWLHLPGHAVSLSPTEVPLARQLLLLLQAGGFNPPWTRDLAHQLNRPEDDIRRLLRKLLRQGLVFQVVRDLFYHPEQLNSLAALLAELAAQNGVRAADYRDATGLGRKRALQLLDYFGRVGYTRRYGDRHLLRKGCSLFAGAETLQAVSPPEPSSTVSAR